MVNQLRVFLIVLLLTALPASSKAGIDIFINDNYVGLTNANINWLINFETIIVRTNKQVVCQENLDRIFSDRFSAPQFPVGSTLTLILNNILIGRLLEDTQYNILENTIRFTTTEGLFCQITGEVPIGEEERPVNLDPDLFIVDPNGVIP